MQKVEWRMRNESQATMKPKYDETKMMRLAESGPLKKKLADDQRSSQKRLRIIVSAANQHARQSDLAHRFHRC